MSAETAGPTSFGTMLQRGLIAGVLALLLWLPLPLGSNHDWSVAVLIVWVGLLATVYAAGALANPASLRGARPPGVVLVMAACLLFVQAMLMAQLWLGWSVDSGQSWRQLWLGLAYTALFVLVTGLFRCRARLTLLLAVIVVGGTFQAFYGAFMTLAALDGPLASLGYQHGRSASGTYVNRNHMAGYLAMCLGCGIGLLLALRSDQPARWTNLLETLLGPKMRLRLALAIMVVGLVMTHSRMGNAAFVLSLLVVGGVFAWRDTRHRVRNFLILGSIVIVDVLIISQFFGLDTLRDRVAQTRFQDVVVAGEVVARENVDRDDVFAYALPLALQRPLAGQGAGAFESAFPAWLGPDIPGHFDHAHNDYLQFWIEFGAPASAALVLFVLIAAREATRALLVARSVYGAGVACGALMALSAVAWHSLTDFNLQIPANAAFFMVVCAVAVLSFHHHRERALNLRR